MRIQIKPWIPYALIALIMVASYPYIADLVAQQFGVYQIHMGNPASYVFLFTIFGWWFDRYYRGKWGKGKMGVRGYALMFVGLIIMTLILKYVFGYQFAF